MSDSSSAQQPLAQSHDTGYQIGNIVQDRLKALCADTRGGGGRCGDTHLPFQFSTNGVQGRPANELAYGSLRV
jgi:hypothetical protein